MKYKAVLFDLDGTLLDSVPIILRASEIVFQDMSIPYDEAAMRKTIGIPLITQAEQFAGDRADEFVVRYKATYRQCEDGHIRLFPGTMDMLDALRSLGCLTGLVTSKSKSGAKTALEKTGLSEHFDVLVSADDVVNPKPQPEPILKALKKLTVEPHQAVYVGDSLFDVDCAQQAGVDMATVTWGARSKEDLLLMCPDRVFDSWSDFLNWIQTY